MSKHHDTFMSQADSSAAGSVHDAPVFNGSPAMAEFDARRPLPRPIRSTRTRSITGMRKNLLGAFIRTGGHLRRKVGELRQQVGTRRRRLDPLVTFAREILADPRTIGAVCPSSPHLAQAMAREVGNIDDGLVLELGAGTGSITHALLQQGIDPARLVAIERSAAMAAHLRERFPAIRVLEGDATQLGKLLGKDAERVRAVVSGLPLRSLPRPVVREITRQVQQVLPEAGVFVQFTYNLRTPSLQRDKALRKERTRLIWRNVPPARVDTFARQADTARRSTVITLDTTPTAQRAGRHGKTKANGQPRPPIDSTRNTTLNSTMGRPRVVGKWPQ